MPSPMRRLRKIVKPDNQSNVDNVLADLFKRVRRKCEPVAIGTDLSPVILSNQEAKLVYRVLFGDLQP